MNITFKRKQKGDTGDQKLSLVYTQDDYNIN